MSQSFLTVYEAEIYTKELQEIELETILSKRWLREHERLEKLTAQATIHVINKGDEFIKEFFISYNKVNLLVCNLLTLECWKQKIFPIIITNMKLEKTNFPIYTALHQELILSGLIDIIIYRSDGCQSMEQTMPDLIDYCHRYIALLTQRDSYASCFPELILWSTKSLEEHLNIGETDNMKVQSERINFLISIKCISMLSSIINNLNELPLAIRHRLLNVHDVVMLLVQLLETLPWKFSNGEKTFIFNDQKWAEIPENEEEKILKIEGEVWISLINILMDSDNLKKYSIDHFRKSQLIKLCPRLTETVIDQIPALSNLRQFLEQLKLFDPPPAKNDLIMEQTPVIFEGLQLKYKDQWNTIANRQQKMLENLSRKEMEELGKILSKLYTSDIYEDTGN
ncbi:Zinc finger MYND domain-containing protein 10 [Chamberlinius hualienensis]